MIAADVWISRRESLIIIKYVSQQLIFTVFKYAKHFGVNLKQGQVWNAKSEVRGQMWHFSICWVLGISLCVMRLFVNYLLGMTSALRNQKTTCSHCTTCSEWDYGHTEQVVRGGGGRVICANMMKNTAKRKRRLMTDGEFKKERKRCRERQSDITTLQVNIRQ